MVLLLGIIPKPISTVEEKIPRAYEKQTPETMVYR